ncbi:hypothetical protein BsWGS_09551 [Bradybaena similaris]
MECTMLRWLLLLVLAPTTKTQQTLTDCPNPWIVNNASCYNFVPSTDMTYQEASIACLQSYSTLVSVNSADEHRFLQNWLNKHDSLRRDWFTSGYRDLTGRLLWESDGSAILTDYFPSPSDRNKTVVDPVTKIEYNQIVYRFFRGAQNEYSWAWSRLMKTSPFICELSLQDSWKLYQQKRDFSYGANTTDPNLLEIGPNITYQSPDTIFFETSGHMTTVVLDCQATGYPTPSYRWFRKSASQTNIQWLTSDLGSRYTVTNGRLTITNPDPNVDVSVYTCEASNKLGKVISNPVEVLHGFIDQFSNVPPSAIVATMYMGKEIVCQPPNHNTDLAYQWYKNTVFNFIRPELNAQYFLSRNGRLYISEVQAADHDMYYCAIFMAPKTGQVLANSQAPSRNSMGIQLDVIGENANTYGPDIQDKFPQYFPSVPMVGDKIDVECLAYGRLPLYYSWVRNDGPMHPGATYSDHNRVLTIPKARLEDTGSYTCVVRGDRNTANRTIVISLLAPPSFPFPLQNQHVDADSKLTWMCNAIGVPRPTYTWYKNGVPLLSSAPDGLTINRNILTINKVNAVKHNGMYECEATNVYASSRSSAQLRALSFRPTFKNRPVPSSKQGAEGGNITIACRPEAAPRPTIRWTKNGLEIGTVSPNGDLVLTFLKKGDAGKYTCVADNVHGQANSSCVLLVQDGVVFSEVPADQVIEQNHTASLQCKASYDKSKTDVTYSWMFNSHLIDLTGTVSDDALHYSMPYVQSQDSGMLYILNAQFRNEGEYTCIVSTVTGSISSKAMIQVKGPPGEPGGVHARVSSGSTVPFGKVQIWWQDGETHYYPVHKYAIEYQTHYDEEDGHKWRLLKADILEPDVRSTEYKNWLIYEVTEGLSPGTEYRFTVKAGNNQVGYGPPSEIPSIWYKMISAPPVYAPENLRGGGGSVGELHIEWDPLPRSLWGATSINYWLHYRKKDERNPDGKWQTAVNLTSTVFNTVVGQALYYTPYEVKVQAMNELGKGPNSSIAIIYSAEDMPYNVAPKFIQANAVNATAGIVEWEPIPNTREAAKGTIFAYQVNYWLEGDTRCLGKHEDTARFIRFYGDRGSGLIVGMEYALDYCLNLQFLNRAGLGPKTDNYYIGMNFAPPSHYPEYVTVMSHGNESVRLLWRGVSTIWGEEPVIGYKAWYWDAREDIRSAKIAYFQKTSTGVIHKVEKDVIYKVRMLAYSIGGDGKKSQDVFFTLGGQVMFDPSTTEIMNSAPSMQLSSLLTIILMSVILLVQTIKADL